MVIPGPTAKDCLQLHRKSSVGGRDWPRGSQESTRASQMSLGKLPYVEKTKRRWESPTEQMNLLRLANYRANTWFHTFNSVLTIQRPSEEPGRRIFEGPEFDKGSFDKPPTLRIKKRLYHPERHKIWYRYNHKESFQKVLQSFYNFLMIGS